MVWVVFSDIIPTAHERVSPVLAGVAVTVAFAAMVGLQLVFTV